MYTSIVVSLEYPYPNDALLTDGAEMRSGVKRVLARYAAPA